MSASQQVSHVAPSRVVSVHDVQHRQGADCGVRCYAERKQHCKELHRWSRSLLHMIGLETVAQRVLHRRRDKPPRPSTPQDWQPSDRCPICNEKRLGVVEPKPTPPAAPKAPATPATPSLHNILEQQQQALLLVGAEQQLALYMQWCAFMQLAASGSAASGSSAQITPPQHDGSPRPALAHEVRALARCSEQPLDLSLKTGDSVDGDNKRAYSQFDLDKAVTDIRLGKLGTRRASVVYGIPRSTLRNKIYKLEGNRRGAIPPPPDSVESTKSDRIDETIGDVIEHAAREDSDASSNGSKRAKRGHYRQYDKEALEQAVTAVRSGEMSVHRAGSLFGVPHSTLEYKVKDEAPSFWQQLPDFFAGLDSKQ